MASEIASEGLNAGLVTPAVETIPARAYGPSWVNLAIDWLERLPGPTWLAYVVAAAAMIAFSFGFTALEPLAANLPVGNGLYYAVLPIAALALIASLDRSAGRALQTLRPILLLDDREIAAAHHRLTVAPGRPSGVIGVVSLVLTGLTLAADPKSAGIEGWAPLSVFGRFVLEGLITAIFLVMIYHTVRQLREIASLHDRVGRVDVFNQAPLYAMSGVTSGTAAGLLILLAPSLLLLPQDAGVSYAAITVGWYGFALAIAIAAFFLPLRGMHVRLDREKDKLRGEVGRRMSTTIAALNAAIDAGQGAAIETHTKAVAALLAERDVVNRVPTWPWSTASLTRFISAVLLPLGLWLATRMLERLV